MRKDKRNIILFAAILIFLVGGLIVYNVYTEGPVNVQTGKAIEINPASLYKAYVTDSINARKMYDGKIIRIIGEVVGTTENTDRQQVILLRTSTHGGNINCTMENAVPGIQPGNVISVQGICSGIGQVETDLGIPGDVYLTRAITSN